MSLRRATAQREEPSESDLPAGPKALVTTSVALVPNGFLLLLVRHLLLLAWHYSTGCSWRSETTQFTRKSRDLRDFVPKGSDPAGHAHSADGET